MLKIKANDKNRFSHDLVLVGSAQILAYINPMPAVTAAECRIRLQEVRDALCSGSHDEIIPIITEPEFKMLHGALDHLSLYWRYEVFKHHLKNHVWYLDIADSVLKFPDNSSYSEVAIESDEVSSEEWAQLQQLRDQQSRLSSQKHLIALLDGNLQTQQMVMSKIIAANLASQRYASRDANNRAVIQVKANIEIIREQNNRALSELLKEAQELQQSLVSDGITFNLPELLPDAQQYMRELDALRSRVTERKAFVQKQLDEFLKTVSDIASKAIGRQFIAIQNAPSTTTVALNAQKALEKFLTQNVHMTSEICWKNAEFLMQVAPKYASLIKPAHVEKLFILAGSDKNKYVPVFNYLNKHNLSALKNSNAVKTFSEAQLQELVTCELNPGAKFLSRAPDLTRLLVNNNANNLRVLINRVASVNDFLNLQHEWLDGFMLLNNLFDIERRCNSGAARDEISNQLKKFLHDGKKDSRGETPLKKLERWQ